MIMPVLISLKNFDPESASVRRLPLSRILTNCRLPSAPPSTRLHREWLSPVEVFSSDFLDFTILPTPVRLCEKCGVLIDPERLEAIPDTQLCVSCKRRDEAKPSSVRVTDVDCPRCAHSGIKAQMVWRTARDPERTGYFLGCSRFPDCRYIDKSRQK